MQFPLASVSFWDLALCLSVAIAVFGSLIGLVIFLSLEIAHNSPVPKWRPRGSPIHLLLVLGSGGHTAEMFYMLEKTYMKEFTYRTYVVSSGDNFSAGKAKAFETQRACPDDNYNIVTVPRARRVHQSYLTAPFTTLQCFWACLNVLCGLHPDQRLPKQYVTPYPDLILTNGPATAVCMALAAKLIRLFQYVSGFNSLLRSSATPRASRLRIIHFESWARVKKLSMSGVLLLPLADTFLVQWPALGGLRAWWGMKRTKYAGWLVI
ncbi:hypothetical protein PENANT_c014G07320 [Penicillium antarcticum]|uniref:UDP-N-acetylglucosamine transferase subunit ALG14 n=1 Tax=Penicillium antarcticum TaxID=416450 RepID=A0A1V6Q511_9EURO|nr:uncharacterized protein N7508_009671 [Penicillium antarcticum]KAJ5294850.1 hypothetical protein N7508_009671 [Penicillium antarcticum]OQD84097.1 hypothetical protein PENANT_c014G07320 [Penicillium antarcticum]